MLVVFGVRVMLIVLGICVQVSSALDAVIVIGAPELQLKIPPNCHRSTIRFTAPGALLKNFRPGPNGISKVPLLRKSCVRWNASRLLLRLRFLGSKYSSVLSALFSPRPRLHV